MEKQIHNMIVITFAVMYVGISVQCTSFMSMERLCKETSTFLEGTPEKSLMANSDYQPTNFARISIENSATASTVSPSPSFENIDFS